VSRRDTLTTQPLMSLMPFSKATYTAHNSAIDHPSTFYGYTVSGDPTGLKEEYQNFKKVVTNFTVRPRRQAPLF